MNIVLIGMLGACRNGKACVNFMGHAERTCECASTFDTGEPPVVDGCDVGPLTCRDYQEFGDQVSSSSCEGERYDAGALWVSCACAEWQFTGGCSPCSAND